MCCKLKILDGWCDVSDVSATPAEVLEALQIIEEQYRKYIDSGIDTPRALALTALKLASNQVEPDSKITNTTRHNGKVIVNGIELHFRAAESQEYVYRKAAKVANNIFDQIKPNIIDEQEVWYRVLLELALATKITYMCLILA
jgi:hypothetical protein